MPALHGGPANARLAWRPCKCLPCLERTRYRPRDKNTSSSLVLDCIIYSLLVNPFRNLSSTRSIKPFHPGRVLGALEVCPGNLGRDILVSTLHSLGPGQS